MIRYNNVLMLKEQMKLVLLKTESLLLEIIRSIIGTIIINIKYISNKISYYIMQIK